MDIKALLEKLRAAETKAQAEEARDELLDAYQTVRNSEAGVGADEVAVLTEIKAGIEEATASIAEFEAAEAELADQLAELDEGVLPSDDADEDETAEVDADADEVDVDAEADADVDADADEKELVTASGGKPSAAKLAARVPAKAKSKPEPETEPGVTWRAGADVHNKGAVLDRSAIDAAVAEVGEAMRGSNAGDGVRMKAASFQADIDADRWLDGTFAQNREKIETAKAAHIANASDHDYLEASGGICDPLPANRAIEVIGGTSRPVRDCLVRFGADDGGVRYVLPLGLPGYEALTAGSGAFGVVTEAQDAAGYISQGGTTPDKSCFQVPCRPETSVVVDEYYSCLCFGNFQQRFNQENVSEHVQLNAINFARQAELQLLAGLTAGSTAVTGPAIATLGAYRTVLNHAITLASGIRARHRLPKEFPVRAIIPQYLCDLIREDLINQPSHYPGQDTPTNDDVVRLFRAQGVNLCISPDLDIATFGVPQAAGNINQFPATIPWFVFPEGTWSHLDGGVLDLGVVRDSVLNTTNDYCTWMASFENVMFTGLESYLVTSALCPSGAASAPIAVPCPTF